MSAAGSALTHHPAPHADRVGLWESLFGLCGGPAAWFAYVCIGYALADQPCYDATLRLPRPPNTYAWTGVAMAVAAVVAFVIAVVACWSSARAYRRTADEMPGGHAHLLEVGTGRTRFLAFWGLVSGASFAVAIFSTAVGLSVLPRCAG